MHDDIERRFSSRARSRAQLLSGSEFGAKMQHFFEPTMDYTDCVT